MKLYLIRHPQPEIAPGICYGSTDLPLREGACAEVLQKLLPQLTHLPGDTPIFSSPMRRAMDLAQALALVRGPAVQVVQGVQVIAQFQEMNFGNWEMRAWDQIAREDVDAWMADLLHYRPGDAENVLQMTQRVMQGIAILNEALIECDVAESRGQEIAETHMPRAAILICHGGTIRIIKSWQGLFNGAIVTTADQLGQIAHMAAMDQQKISYGELIEMDFDLREMDEKKPLA